MKGELRFSKPHLSFLSKSTTTRGAQITSILWKSRKRQSYAFDSYLADRHIILTVKNHSVVVCGCVRIHMPIFVWFDLVLYLMKFFSRRGLHLQPYKIRSLQFSFWRIPVKQSLSVRMKLSLFRILCCALSWMGGSIIPH